jgi:hypothetical protein
MGLKTEKDQKRYLYILADGRLHEKAEEGDEGAKKRIFEKKNEKGEVVELVEKWEYSYPGVVGTIKDIKFYESDYGTNINIDITDEEENEFVLSLKASSRYGEAFMEALPNLDLAEEVDFTVYSFPDPKNKERKVQGMKIVQDDEKVRSYFTAYDTETKIWSYPIAGYPVPNEKTKKKNTPEVWKIFFATRNEWLKDYMIDNNFISVPEEKTEEEKNKDENF